MEEFEREDGMVNIYDRVAAAGSGETGQSVEIDDLVSTQHRFHGATNLRSKHTTQNHDSMSSPSHPRQHSGDVVSTLTIN